MIEEAVPLERAASGGSPRHREDIVPAPFIERLITGLPGVIASRLTVAAGGVIESIYVLAAPGRPAGTIARDVSNLLAARWGMKISPAKVAVTQLEEGAVRSGMSGIGAREAERQPDGGEPGPPEGERKPDRTVPQPMKSLPLFSPGSRFEVLSYAVDYGGRMPGLGGGDEVSPAGPSAAGGPDGDIFVRLKVGVFGPGAGEGAQVLSGSAAAAALVREAGPVPASGGTLQPPGGAARDTAPPSVMHAAAAAAVNALNGGLPSGCHFHLKEVSTAAMGGVSLVVALVALHRTGAAPRPAAAGLPRTDDGVAAAAGATLEAARLLLPLMGSGAARGTGPIPADGALRGSGSF